MNRERERVKSKQFLAKPFLQLFLPALGVAVFLLALQAKPAQAAAATSTQSGLWSATSTWVGGVVPGDGDTVSIANTHTVTVDTNTTVGASGAPVYSQVTAVSVGTGGSGGSGACTVTFSGGTQAFSSPAKATCTLSGGAVTSVTLTDRGWYTGASAAPTCSFSATGLTGATCSVDTFVQGGGTAAINLNASGQLVIATGATVTVRGSIQYTGGSGNTTNSITMQPGSHLLFDSSQATGTPIYDFGQTADYGYRNINAVCTADQRCSISATGNIGVLATHGFLRGGGITAKYVDFSNLGDTKTPNQIGWNSTYVIYDVEHSTFTNCGRWQYVNYAGADSTLIHANNVHTATNDTTALYLNALGALTTGTRQITGNVFDKTLGPANTFAIPGLTLTDNYFGNGFASQTAASNVLASLTRNFVRISSGNPQPSATTDFVDNYVLIDQVMDNPHVISALETTPITAGGNVFGYTDDISLDSGELFVPRVNPASPTVYSFLNNIVLPNRLGSQWAEASAVTVAFTNSRPTIDHNVWFGGRNVAPSGFGIFQINEGGNSQSPNATSLRSNILWSPTTPVLGFVKVNSANKTNPTVDVIDPSMADYNNGWNFNDAQTGCTGCTNMGNGYGGAWSSTPGAHDVNADPQFVDYQRTVELFDSKYLGHSYSDWSGSASYNIGDQVSHAVTDYSWDLPVNYRYINTAACASANPEPGNTAANANWRDCWEFSSLYQLRQNWGTILPVNPDLAAYQPSSCTAETNTILCELMAWTRAGYAPQNRALKAAAHDGGDIGAVAFVDANPTTVSMSSPAASATLSGSSVTLTATATDTSGISGVSFYYDSTHLIGSEVVATSSPDTYTATLDSTALSDGSHTLIAVSRDSFGNTATSTPVTVTVSNNTASGSRIDPASYSPPIAPTGGFALQINQGQASITNPNVSLSLTAGPDTTAIALSNTPGFENAVPEPYVPNKAWDWNLCWISSAFHSPNNCSLGLKTVYAKAFNAFGRPSDPFSAAISYVAGDNSQGNNNQNNNNNNNNNQGNNHNDNNNDQNNNNNQGNDNNGNPGSDNQNHQTADESANYSSNALINDHGTVYLIMGQAKYGFTSLKAFLGLDYLLKHVQKGDTSSYPQTGVISSATQAHIDGSWIISGRTVFYVSKTGYIPVPAWDIFLNNGGLSIYIVKANYEDIVDKRPVLPLMTMDDARVGK